VKEGFDFGNSPSSITEEQICGKEIIHTTSAGTQGIVNAFNADSLFRRARSLSSSLCKHSRVKKLRLLLNCFRIADKRKSFDGKPVDFSMRIW